MNRDDTEHRRSIIERRSKVKGLSKAMLHEAFKERAWMQAMLLQCYCCYPLQKAETESEHEMFCPAHALHMVRKPCSP